VPALRSDKIDVDVRCLDGVGVDALDVPHIDGSHWQQAIGSAHWHTPRIAH
jgi:hypothetical protein